MPEWKQEIRQRLSSLKLEPAREAAIVEELSQHLEDRYAESLASGATPEEAYLLALAELSDGELLARELGRIERQAPPEPIVPGARGRGNMIADLWQDLRYGARMLMKQPGFTLVATLTLGLGIGVNTAIFSVFNLAFRPLPIKDASSVADLDWGRWEQRNFSFPDYVDLRDRTKVFDGLVAGDGKNPLGLTIQAGAENSQAILGEFVSDNFFSVLGVGAALGRAFAPGECRVPGEHPIVVLSHRFWRQQFGGDANLLGQTLRLNGKPFVVIGVTEPDFAGLNANRTPDLWLPLMMRGEISGGQHDWFGSRDKRWLFVSGRIKPGRTLAEARAEMALLSGQLVSADPKKNANTQIRAHPLSLSGGDFDSKFWSFMGIALGATLMVLLIACSNLINLMLARAAGRAGEIGVRLCLGASRWRLIRQMLAESFLLAALGGALGLLLAWWSVKAFVLWYLVDEPGMQALDLSPDARVLTYTFLLSLFSTVAFGLVPALRGTRHDLAATLKDQGAAFGQRIARSGLRNALVVAQVSLSLILLISAGLLLRGLRQATGINVGFDPANVLVTWARWHLSSNDKSRFPQFNQEWSARLARLPGVQAVTWAQSIPFGGVGQKLVFLPGTKAALDDQAPTQSTGGLSAYFNAVAPNYFDALGLSLVRGRVFTEAEARDGAAVIVVSESTARRLWPNQEPLGQLLRTKPNAPFAEVVGVTRDVRVRLDESDPLFFYEPLPNWETGLTLARTSGVAKELKSLAQAEARALVPDLLVEEMTVEELIANQKPLRGARPMSSVAACLGLLALLLAAIGLYGVMAYSVSQRTREIGIRMALGAQASDALRLIIRQGMTLTLVGVSIGLAASLALTRVLKSMLFGLSATDSLTFIVIALLLVCVALVACYIPARHATKVDPMVSLRHE